MENETCRHSARVICIPVAYNTKFLLARSLTHTFPFYAATSRRVSHKVLAVSMPARDADSGHEFKIKEEIQGASNDGNPFSQND